MNQSSLRQVMETMAERLDVQKARKTEMQLTAEIEAGIASDPLLGELYKEYLNARAQCARLLREKGCGDAMASVGVDRLESCLGALETRLIELRRTRDIQRLAIFRLKALRDEMEREDQKNLMAKRRSIDQEMHFELVARENLRTQLKRQNGLFVKTAFLQASAC